MRLRNIKEDAAKGRNVANTAEIENMAKSMAARVTPQIPNHVNILKWIKGNFRNFMIREYPDATRLVAARDGMPDWILINAKKAGMTPQQYLTQNEIYWVNITPQFGDEVQHVMDMLNTTRGPDVAAKRPGEDLQRLTVPEAIKKAEELNVRALKYQQKLMAKKGTKATVDPEWDDRAGTHVMIEYDNGWHWVQILHSTDKEFAGHPMLGKVKKGTQAGAYSLESPNPVMRRETYFMQHCVGAGYGYDEKCRKGTHHYYSLRDANALPKVTIESEGGDQVSGSKGKLGQVQAFGNKPPGPELIPYVADFIKKGKLQADKHVMQRMGLIQFGEELLTPDEVAKLTPDDLVKLNPTREQLRTMGLFRSGSKAYRMDQAGDLPREVLANSDLEDSELDKIGMKKTDKGIMKWEEMQAGTTIEGDVVFNNVLRAIDLPQGLKIKGSFTATRFLSKELPEGMVVGKDFTLTDSETVKMPEKMAVGGNVKISKTPVKNFPVDLQCVNVELEDTNIDVVVGLRCKQLTIRGTGTRAIGPGCVIEGSLMAGNSKEANAKDGQLAEIAPDVKIGKNLFIARNPIKSLMIEGVGGGVDAALSGIVEIREGFYTRGYIGRGDPKNIPDPHNSPGMLTLQGTKIKNLPPNMSISGVLTLPRSVTVLPPGLKVATCFFFRGTIKVIPPDMQFNVIQVKHDERSLDWQAMKYSPPGEPLKIIASDPLGYIRPGDVVREPDDWNEKPKAKPKAKK